MKKITNLLKQKKNKFLLLLALGAVVLIRYLCHIGCPILSVTGIPCAGCGMSRAMMKCLQFQWREAFAYHPMIFAMPIFFGIYIFWEEIPKKLQHPLIYLSLGLFLGTYFLRLMVFHDPLLEIDFSQSIIGKIIGNIFYNLKL